MSIQAGRKSLDLTPVAPAVTEACDVPLVREPIGAFDLTQPTISHHLRVLREAGIIGSERRGTWVYYRLQPAVLERMAALLSAPQPSLPVS